MIRMTARNITTEITTIMRILMISGSLFLRKRKSKQKKDLKKVELNWQVASKATMGSNWIDRRRRRLRAMEARVKALTCFNELIHRIWSQPCATLHIKTRPPRRSSTRNLRECPKRLKWYLKTVQTRVVVMMVKMRCSPTTKMTLTSLT